MQTKRRRTGWWVLLTIVLVTIISVILWKINSGKDLTKYTTTAVAYGDVSASVSASGQLETLNTYDVKSNVGGVITRLYVDEGDYVTAGQKIAEIDPSDTQMALTQAQATRAASESKYAQADDNIKLTIAQDDANIASAVAAVTVAKQHLHQAELQSASQPDITNFTITQASAAVDQATHSVEQSTANVEQINANIEQAKSNCDDAQAGFQQVQNVTNPQLSSSAKSALDQAQANYSNASKNLDRQQALLAKGFVAQGAVDTAQQQNDMAHAQLTDAQNKMNTVAEQCTQNLNSAKAKVNQTNAALTQAQASLRQAQAALKQSQATLAQSSAALAIAKKNAAQDPTLKADDYQAAKATLAQAQAALALANANRAQEKMRKSDKEQNLQALVNAKAVEQNAITNKNWCTVTAPSDGIVLQKFVQVGSTVVNGRLSAMPTGTGVSIVTIGDINHMTALVNVDETDLAQVTKEQRVRISVDAFPGLKFIGKVTKIAPQTTITQNVTTVPVTVEVSGVDTSVVAPPMGALKPSSGHMSGGHLPVAQLQNTATAGNQLADPRKKLKPGMTATCDFITDEHRHVLVVPNEALKEGAGGTTVNVLIAGKPVERKVETGLAGDDATEILHGVALGEKVVTASFSPTGAQQPTSTPAQKGSSSSKNQPHGPF